jgi:hypothetical protein
MNTPHVTKRLQVLLEEEELAAIRRAARERHQSVAEGVRAALRRARAADEGRSVSDRLAVLHSAAALEYPTGPIEQILDEIGQGYRTDG